MGDELPAFNHRAVRPMQCLSEGWELVSVVTAGLDYIAFLKKPA